MEARISKSFPKGILRIRPKVTKGSRNICEMIESQKPDCNVSCFASGEELFAATKLFDIIFFDIQMDGMSGIEAAKEACHGTKIRGSFWVGIEGMACGMCEAHINEAVRNAFQVKKVISSHTKKQTAIFAEQDIPEQELKSVVAKTGYDVVSVDSEPYEKKGLFAAFRGWLCAWKERTG